MKNKKYLFLKEVLITLCLVSTFNVFAHPGRTDANGGHWDRSNGTYHFHTGEYAGRSSSGTADLSDSEPKPFVPPYEPPENNPYKKEVDSKEQTPIVALILCFVFLFVPLGFGVVSVVGIVATLIHEKFIQGKLPIHKIMTLDKKIDELCEYQKELDEIRIIKFQIPDRYEISKDNLPKDKQSDSNWGNSFTLYRTPKGSKLHKKFNCCSANIPTHIYRYRNNHNIKDSLCGKCAFNYVAPNMSWYDDYIKYQKATSRSEIIKNNCTKLQKEILVLYKKCNSPKTKCLIMFSKKSKSALQEVNKKYKELHKKEIA